MPRWRMKIAASFRVLPTNAARTAAPKPWKGLRRHRVYILVPFVSTSFTAPCRTKPVIPFGSRGGLIGLADFLIFPPSIHRYFVFTQRIVLTPVKQLFTLIGVDG
jgi:hypothetical protein